MCDRGLYMSVAGGPAMSLGRSMEPRAECTWAMDAAREGERPRLKRVATPGRAAGRLRAPGSAHGGGK